MIPQLTDSVLIRRDPMPDSLFIVENAALEELLFSRNVVGWEFQRTCLRASELFLEHLADELTDLADDISELVILSKGLTYQLSAAYPHTLGRSLPMNLIATKRSSVSSDDAAVDVSYFRFDAPTNALLIRDTVASGATVVASLRVYMERHALHRLYLVSYAGALVGARRIAAFCAANGVELEMLYGLAAFGLGENGFDLSFLHPDTLTGDRYRDRAADQFDGRAVSAVGWDFGSQVMSPRKYAELCWMEAERWQLHGHPCFALEREPHDLSALSAEAAAFGS